MKERVLTLKNYIQKNQIKPKSQESLSEFRQRYFLEENPSSLAEMKLKNIIYIFYMKESGAKLMKCYGGTIYAKDIRQGSKLKCNKDVIFNFPSE